MAARKQARSHRKPSRSKSSARKRPARAPRAARAKKPAKRKAAPRKAAPRRAKAAPARFSSDIGFTSQHMDYTSHDMDGMRRFYTQVLGFKQVKDMPELNYLAVNTGPSSSFGFMPPMPGPPEQWQPPREPTIYLFVADVDRAHENLVAKGVTFEQEPQNMPWGHRVARLRDPEGRNVCLAQVLKT